MILKCNKLIIYKSMQNKIFISKREHKKVLVVVYCRTSAGNCSTLYYNSFVHQLRVKISFHFTHNLCITSHIFIIRRGGEPNTMKRLFVNNKLHIFIFFSSFEHFPFHSHNSYSSFSPLFWWICFWLQDIILLLWCIVVSMLLFLYGIIVT